MQNRTLIVLGGNAFAWPGERLTMAGQFRFAREALAPMLPLLMSDSGIVVTHGNGPQVGHMLIRVEEALGKAYAVPLEVCVAETEGELGYVLAQTLHNLLREHVSAWRREAGGLSPGNRQSSTISLSSCQPSLISARPIVSLLTQVVVDAADPAFQNPTKPIGPFYREQQAHEMEARGFVVREDAGRGYRRVVPSPLPTRIIEASVIEQLLEWGAIVIAAGGGGIPVLERDGHLEGVEAVIDKDLASALLGEELGASRMVILTCVPCAYRHFGETRQAPIGRVTVAEAERLVDEGHFAPGSMLPKMQAAIRFASRPGATAIICDPPSLPAALMGNAGTVVTNEVTQTAPCTDG